jgi:hypothetical protein
VLRRARARVAEEPGSKSFLEIVDHWLANRKLTLGGER